MDMQEYPAFLPGVNSQKVFLLSRHLPKIPFGIASQWLRSIPEGSWILDPFGSSPQLLREIALEGYRVLATINNPVLQYLTRFSALAPHEDDIRRVISFLSGSRREDMRLEAYLNDLYLIECPSCNQTTSASEFRWQRDDDILQSVKINCSFCGNSDILQHSEIFRRDKVLEFSKQQIILDSQRLLTKIAPPGDPKRIVSTEVLNQFSDRAIHSLVTLLYYVDRNSLSQLESFILDGIFLHVFDQANTLWSAENPNQRLKSLQTPTEFIERNVWDVIINFTDFSMDGEIEIPINIWPDSPKFDAGIYIYPGRLADFLDEEQQLTFRGILTSIPRPNQVFWNSSGVWASLLWKDVPNIEIESMLKRRRYDWSWFTQAVYSVLRYTPGLVDRNTKIFALCTDIESKFLISITAAAARSGINIPGICIDNSEQLAQVHFSQGLTERPVDNQNLLFKVRSLSEEYLKERGEPSSLLSIFSEVFPKILPSLSKIEQINSGTAPYKYLLDLINQNILENIQFEALNRGSRNWDIQRYWLKSQSPLQLTLSDRIELFVCDLLSEKHLISYLDLSQKVCDSFRGPYTPDSAFILHCLNSYATNEPEDGTWKFANPNQPGEFAEVSESIPDIIIRIGEEIGYTVSYTNKELVQVIQYQEEFEASRFTFNYLPHAILADIEINRLEEGLNYLVCSEQLVDLIIYKLRKNPPLAEHIQDHFQIISSKQIINLSQTKHLTKANLPELLTTILIEPVDKQFSLF